MNAREATVLDTRPEGVVYAPTTIHESDEYLHVIAVGKDGDMLIIVTEAEHLFTLSPREPLIGLADVCYGRRFRLFATQTDGKVYVKIEEVVKNKWQILGEFEADVYCLSEERIPLTVNDELPLIAFRSCLEHTFVLLKDEERSYMQHILSRCATRSFKKKTVHEAEFRPQDYALFLACDRTYLIPTIKKCWG